MGRRGGCWAIIIKQLELASRRVIVSIWRAVLLIWIVWRVVGRVIIVTRVAHGENGSRYSDDDEGGATDDRHGSRRWSIKERECRMAYTVIGAIRGVDVGRFCPTEILKTTS